MQEAEHAGGGEQHEQRHRSSTPPGGTMSNPERIRLTALSHGAG
jgi:hypothetical protein